MPSLTSLALAQLLENATVAKVLSDQNVNETRLFCLHQGCLKSLKFFLALHQATPTDMQTISERELYQKVEYQLSFYVGFKVLLELP